MLCCVPRRRVIPPETKIEGTPIDSLTNAGGATPPGFRRGRTVGIVGILTLVVSIFGYIREAVLAARFGARFATRTSHRLVRRSWPYNRLYFRLAHRTRYSLMRLKSGYNMDW